ncbi:hypothetical protein [Fluviicola sp.]|uniref:hypothetical protein n=1 Tax=Fluviicola sp. TaxID=1917219 RepID=UPI0026084311|nr:hypothetical protein [Fluviicola sp.]
MKKIIPFIGIIIIGLSCKREKIHCIRPYTQKELRFISDFSIKGFKVELNRFNYSYSGDSLEVCARYLTDLYTIRIENEPMTGIQNIDSMQAKARQIASEFYGEIIEDSILVQTAKIVVHISTKILEKKLDPKNSKSPAYEDASSYSATFRKKDLESYCGFRITEHKNKIIREKVEKTTNLPLFSESKRNSSL